MTPLSALLARLRGPSPCRGGRPPACRPVLERLEDRRAPATFTFAPQADAYVNQGAPASNAGTSTHLYTEPASVESYLRFAVAGVSGSVQSAKLRLYVLIGASVGPTAYTTGTS